jgi:hypothetical protein
LGQISEDLAKVHGRGSLKKIQRAAESILGLVRAIYHQASAQRSLLADDGGFKADCAKILQN